MLPIKLSRSQNANIGSYHNESFTSRYFRIFAHRERRKKS